MHAALILPFVQLHGALSATVLDVPGQNTSFTYVNFTSNDIESQHLETFRPAGAGCTLHGFVNYSPFATVDDNSCIEGQLVRFESVAADGDNSGLDWYNHGLVMVSEPALYGGHSIFSPVLFTEEHVTHREHINVLPGRLSVHLFGDTRFMAFLGDDLLYSSNGSESAITRDAHGFLSTLGDAHFHFVVPEKYTQQQVLSSDGGVIGGSGAGTVVIETGALESPIVVSISMRNASFHKRTFSKSADIFFVVPHKLRLVIPATIIIPLAVSDLSLKDVNALRMILRVTDERNLDSRVVPGSLFSGGHAYAEVDHFSVLSVVARAEVLMISPKQRPLHAGSSVTLFGNNFNSVPMSPAVLCKFGDKFKTAEIHGRKIIGGQADVVFCKTPLYSQAGFTTVELHDSKTFSSSGSGRRILFTASATVTGLLPSVGARSGGSLVTIRGYRLQAATTLIIASCSGDSGGSSTRTLDNIYCSINGRESSAMGFLISSSIGVCETSAVPHQTRATRVYIGSLPDAGLSRVAFEYQSGISEVGRHSISFDAPDLTKQISGCYPRAATLLHMHSAYPSAVFRALKEERAKNCYARFLFTASLLKALSKVTPVDGNNTIYSIHFDMTGTAVSCLGIHYGNRKLLVRQSASLQLLTLPALQTHVLAISVLLGGGDDPIPADFARAVLLHASWEASTSVAIVAGSSGCSRGGSNIWLAVSNILQHEKGSNPVTRDSDTVFSTTRRSVLKCRFAELANSDYRPRDRFNRSCSHIANGNCFAKPFSSVEQITTPRLFLEESVAHVVSSAVASCIAPLPSGEEKRNRSSSSPTPSPYEQYSQGFPMLVSLTSAKSRLTSALAIKLISEPILTAVSLAYGGEHDGGWYVASVRRSGVVRGYNWEAAQLACAFGTIAPVTLNPYGQQSKEISNGICASPALGPIKMREHVSYQGMLSHGIKFGLLLPNSGRVYLETQKFMAINQKEHRTVPQLKTTATVGLAGMGRSKYQDCFDDKRSQHCIFNMHLFGACGFQLAVFSKFVEGTFTGVGLFDHSVLNFCRNADFEIELYFPKKVFAVNPTQAHLHGGTLVSITGTNLRQHNYQLSTFCVIGMNICTANAVSSALVQCEAPPWKYENAVYFGRENYTWGTQILSFSGIENGMASHHQKHLTVSQIISTAALRGSSLQYVPNPQIVVTHPHAGTADGTVVTVYGLNLSQEGSMCVFGTIFVAPAVWNSSQIDCVAPNHAVATVPFTVVLSLSAQYFSGGVTQNVFTFM